ncbi:autotransporter outer membrane beta-barrel domain-containing protein [Campylobacter majalis]|uniref:autotransporter outer membrane beta-barrel domain-containing protein n=1 Tax=Campylobacter majalis TaxID=2790656 RepID=UPI003D68A44A
MKKAIMLSLILSGSLCAVDVTFNGDKNDDKIRPYVKDRALQGGYDIELTGEVDNKLTFDYEPNNQTSPDNVNTTAENDKDVHGNVFTIKNGKYSQFGYAGVTTSGNAYKNKAILEKGYAGISLTGGFSNFKSAYENEVEIKGGKAEVVYGGQLGHNSGTAYNNKVTVSGGEVGSAFGAGDYATTDDAGDMYNNEVIISGGKITKAAIGASNEKKGSAYGNKVTISGGEIVGNVFGSRVGGKQADIKATKNIVTIDGSQNIQQQSSNQTQNIKFNKDSTVIYGGACGDDSLANGVAQTNTTNCKADVFSGNTLIIKHVADLQVKDIKNFEFINFILSPELGRSRTILSLEGNDNTDLSKTKIGVMMSGGIKLDLGDVVTLIDKTKGSITPPKDMTNTLDDKARTIRTVSGVSKIFTFTLKAESNTGTQGSTGGAATQPSTQTSSTEKITKIIAQVSEVQDNPKQKNIAETSAMMGGMVNESGELATSAGLKGAVNAAQTSGGETASFGSMGGQNVRLNSGSHVDVKGFSVIVGASKQANDSVTYGAFIETGIGNYDSYNNFGNAGSAKGDGKSKYLGTGLMAKFDLTNGYYTEASIRGGKIWSDYKSDDVNPGIRAEFKSARIYWGGHLGFGKIFDIDDSQNIDVYTKLFLTRLNTDTISVIGEKIKFHNSNSIRARVGTRYNKEFNDTIKGYVGVAFEREFNSDAKSTNLTQNEKIKAPTLKGNTAIGELGMKVQTKYKPLTIDFNLQGLGGKREGVTGGVNFEFKF